MGGCHGSRALATPRLGDQGLGGVSGLGRKRSRKGGARKARGHPDAGAGAGWASGGGLPDRLSRGAVDAPGHAAARLWSRLGVGSRAAQATREVMPAIPGSPWLAVWVGQMLARHGEREEACAVYWELGEAPDGHFEVYATLGRYLMSVGQHARAQSAAGRPGRGPLGGCALHPGRQGPARPQGAAQRAGGGGPRPSTSTSGRRAPPSGRAGRRERSSSPGAAQQGRGADRGAAGRPPGGDPGAARPARAADRVGMVPTFQRPSEFNGNWSCPATGRGSLWP